MNKILILTNGDLPHHYFVSSIKSAFAKDEFMVINQNNPSLGFKNFLINRIYNLPIPYKLYGSRILQIDKKKSFNLFFKDYVDKKITKVCDINSPEIIKEVKDFKPKIIFILGGKIVPEVIYRNAITIHLHCGILPWYRGGATWYSNYISDDFSYIGFTLQELDSCIDSGPV